MKIVENVFTNKRKLQQSLNFVYKKLEPFQMLKVEEQKHDEITNIFFVIDFEKQNQLVRIIQFQNYQFIQSKHI